MVLCRVHGFGFSGFLMSSGFRSRVYWFGIYGFRVLALGV